MCNQEVNSMQVYKNTNTDFKQLTQPLIQSSGLNFTHRGRYREGVWWGIVAFGCRISKDDKKCIKDLDLLNGYLSKKQRICNIIPKNVYLLVTNFLKANIMVGNCLRYSIFFRYVKKLLHHDIVSHLDCRKHDMFKKFKVCTCLHNFRNKYWSSDGRSFYGLSFKLYFRINDA